MLCGIIFCQHLKMSLVHAHMRDSADQPFPGYGRVVLTMKWVTIGASPFVNKVRTRS